jgi:NAD-dependent protein deacetylases, SIR2 family
MREVVCTSCEVRTPTAQTLARVAAGEQDPSCPFCGGILKLATVLFGERLDPATIGHAEQIAGAQ